MAAKPDAWMPLYFGAYLSDTMHLTTEQHGAYLLLLMAAWKQGGALPDDDTQLAAITRLSAATWRRQRPVLERFWVIQGGQWRQKRVDAELAKANNMIEQRAIAGKASAAQRWGNGKVTGEERKVNGGDNGKVTKAPRKNAPSPSPSPLPKNLDPEPTPSPTPKTVAAGASPTAATWTAYSNAYFERYQTEPVRNAKVNGQLADFCKRISQDEAPLVAAFYLTHNNPFYVRQRHPVGSLLKDAEGLRTQWATGVKATGLEARSLEQHDAATEQLKRLKADA